MGSEKITKADCKEKIDLRRVIVKDKFKKIADDELSNIGETPTYHYFKPTENENPRNAYLFDTDDILNIHFPASVVDEIKRQYINDKTPTHLLAILGAHSKDKPPAKYDKGQSTVIVMGVKPKDPKKPIDINNNAVNIPVGVMDGGSTLNEEYVGYEYPPSDGIVDQPSSTILPPVAAPMEFKFLS